MEKSHEGLSREQALIEAERCLYCYDAPCEKACPAHVPVPEFIQSIRSSNFKGAFKLVFEANPLIEICGRVCPEESFCQRLCTRREIDSPIRIRELHRFVTDIVQKESIIIEKPQSSEYTVAIIGGGPSGLACARELGREGVNVTIFEKNSLGGIPVQEISKERLPEEIANREVKYIQKNFINSVKDQKVVSLKELTGNYNAIYIGIGLPEELDLSIHNTNLKGVYKAREILKLAKSGRHIKLGKRIGVVGGGNVAVEVASVVKKENPESDVEIIYRRSLKEVRAFKDEIEEAINCGVVFQFMALPLEVKGKESVEGLLVRRTRLKEMEGSTRRVFEEIPGSDFFIPLDTLIIAIGEKSSELFPELKKNENGLIVVSENYMTSAKGVFAGGDAVRGASTIVESVADGKAASNYILQYLKEAGNV